MHKHSPLDAQRMRVSLATVCAVLAVGARAADMPAHPPGCDRALAELQVLEDRAAAAGRAAAAAAASAAPAVLAARRNAAVVCLGVAAARPVPRAGEAQAPISVPPVTALRRPGDLPPLPPGSTGAPALPRSQPPLLTITRCDALGCFASDGSRLSGTGGVLTSPRGVCTTVGAVLSCP